MFDFLKDLGFKAPEEEPQRGTVIQTDEKGKIATMPTEDGKSRIISRDEFKDRNRDFTDVPNYQRFKPPEENRSGIQSFGSQVLSPQRNLFEERLDQDLGNPLSKLDQIALGRGSRDSLGLNQGNPFIGANYPSDRIRDIALQSGAKKIVPSKTYDQIIQEVTEDFPYNSPELNLRLAQDIFTQQQNENTNTTQVGESNQGITSFADAKKEIKKGKEGGIKGYYRPADFPAPRSQGFIDSYNHPLAKFVTPFTDAYGRAIGLDMDTEQGRYDLYNRTQATLKRNKELEEDRRKDQEDRERLALLLAQQQKAKAAVTEEEEEEKKKLYQRNPMSMQDYLNQFKTADMTGDVPLNMYGQLGGEYKYFMADGGQSNIPRGDTGEVTGAGGPKDDLVGPFMLSNKEYVLPNEQIRMYGGGNYETGVRRLEQDRKNALTNFA